MTGVWPTPVRFFFPSFTSGKHIRKGSQAGPDFCPGLFSSQEGGTDDNVSFIWKLDATGLMVVKNLGFHQSKNMRDFSCKAGWELTIKEPNCSPLESGVICSLRLSSSDSSWGLVRETGEEGGGGSARLSESPLRFTSSEMVSQGCHGKRS